MTGFLAGLLGIGGGMLMVPFQTVLLTHRGVAAELTVKMAVATSMSTILSTSLSSVRAHHRRGGVRWACCAAWPRGIVPGGLLAGAGAFISVPFMTWCNVAAHSAVATSAALGFAIALASTLGYAIAGGSLPQALPGAMGYLYLPALEVVAVASVLLAPLGARAAHSMSIAQLRREFALLLYALAGSMVKQGLRG